MVTLGEVVEIVVISMRDAFLAVTVFVAAMVFLFSWLQYATSGRFVEYIREKKLPPLNSHHPQNVLCPLLRQIQ